MRLYRIRPDEIHKIYLLLKSGIKELTSKQDQIEDILIECQDEGSYHFYWDDNNKGLVALHDNKMCYIIRADNKTHAVWLRDWIGSETLSGEHNDSYKMLKDNPRSKGSYSTAVYVNLGD